VPCTIFQSDVPPMYFLLVCGKRSEPDVLGHFWRKIPCGGETQRPTVDVPRREGSVSLLDIDAVACIGDVDLLASNDCFTLTFGFTLSIGQVYSEISWSCFPNKLKFITMNSLHGTVCTILLLKRSIRT
jgi:hypothetical protein